MAVGDFNLDGKPDLATANFNSDNVTILLGNGTGDFTAPAASPDGDADTQPLGGGGRLQPRRQARPRRRRNHSSNNVTILLGNGTGDFTRPRPLAGAGTDPASVAVGDFNLDGKPDLATANNGSDNVTILLNTCDARPCAARLHAARHLARRRGDCPSLGGGGRLQPRRQARPRHGER